MRWLRIEESLAGAAAILIVGLQGQRVTVLSLLWLVAIGSGVMARGGRVHWIGRTIVLAALALPVILQGQLSAEHVALCLASLGLLLTSGRLTRELNHLLRQARHDADNAETLLLAGDIASRVAKRGEAGGERPAVSDRRGAGGGGRVGRQSGPRPLHRGRWPRDRGATDRRRAHGVGARLRGARSLCRKHRRPAALAGDGRGARRTRCAGARLPACRAAPVCATPRRRQPVGQPLRARAARPADAPDARRATRPRRIDRRDHRGDARTERRGAAHGDRPAAGARRAPGGGRHGGRLLGPAPDHDRAPQLPQARPLADQRHRPRLATGPRSWERSSATPTRWAAWW